jgi:hypothetical protein
MVSDSVPDSMRDFFFACCVSVENTPEHPARYARSFNAPFLFHSIAGCSSSWTWIHDSLVRALYAAGNPTILEKLERYVAKARRQQDVPEAEWLVLRSIELDDQLSDVVG